MPEKQKCDEKKVCVKNCTLFAQFYNLPGLVKLCRNPNAHLLAVDDVVRLRRDVVLSCTAEMRAAFGGPPSWYVCNVKIYPLSERVALTGASIFFTKAIYAHYVAL